MIPASPSTPARPRVAASPARLAAVVAVVGLLGGGVAGCSASVPAIVLDAYSPGDGVGAELGEVAVRNLVVVSEGDGEPGVLIGALVSRADSDVNMLLQAEGGLEQLVLLEAGQTVELGTGAEAEVPQAAGTNPGAEAVATLFESVDPIAGDTVPVTVVSEVTGSVTLQVPITSPVREYATITPPADPDVVVVVPEVDGTGAAEDTATAEATATAEDTVGSEDPAGEPSIDPSAEVSANPSDIED